MTVPGGVGGFSIGGGVANARVALRHFSIAFLFLILGVCSLFFNGTTLIEGGYRDVHVVSGIHFLTLGWLSLSIFGALQVFSGVALGASPENPKLSDISCGVWSLGLLFFVFGLFFETSWAVALGILSIGLALLLYSIQIVPIIWKAKRGQITRTFMAIAFFSIWMAWILGLTAGLTRMGIKPDWLPLSAGYFYAHLVFAIFGWVGSMVFGVGSHLVPMFALSRGSTLIPLKITLGTWCLLPVCGVVSIFVPHPWGQICWVLAGIGSIFWGVQFYFYFKARIRKEKDYGLRISAMATIFLVLAWLSIVALPDPVAFISLALIGWLGFFTLGIYHRVVPFLIWFVKFSRPQKGVRPPKVKDLISQRVGFWTEVFFAIGVVLWTIGLYFEEPISLHLGAGGMVMGVLITLLQIKFLIGDPRKEKGVDPWNLQTKQSPSN